MATNSPAFSPLSTQPVFYQGQPVIGAKIYVYDADTNTPRTVYSDGERKSVFDWPFETDSNATIPAFWVEPEPFKVQITTPHGTVIRTIDNIDVNISQSTIAPPPDNPTPTTQSVPTGFIMPAHRTGLIEGWVRANGRTIGNATSGATERANDDTYALYSVLWTADPLLYVLGGRGSTAYDDFVANKTIDLPDYRGRAPFGVADMGGSLTTRLDNITFNAGNKSALGSSAGYSSMILAVENLPSHSHSATSASKGDHSHSGNTDDGGIHAHTNTVELTGRHTHSGTTGSNGSHSHTGSASTGGSHTHSGTCNTAGNHSHGVTDSGHMHKEQALTLTGGNGAGSGVGYQNTQIWTTASNSGVSIQSGGDHSHQVSVNSAGDHGHTLTISAGGDHTHAFLTTETGDHNHLVTISDSTPHHHSYATTTAGAHFHDITVASTGSGTRFTIMPPFILTTWYIKL